MIQLKKIRLSSVVALLCIGLTAVALSPSTTTPALAARKPTRTPTPASTATPILTPTLAPDPGSWSPTGSMSTARAVHTASPLADGRVLVAGGDRGASFATIFASAEIFNPATGLWSDTGSMTHVRSGHTATLLNDGRVLVAGGSDGLPLASAEIYNPA